MADNKHPNEPNGGIPEHSHPNITNNHSDNNNSSNKNNREQDRFLPIANVGRIMKKVIPGNGKISKEAKETVQECVSEFISFVTGEASDKCQKEKRKTINGEDIIWAINILGFEEYVHPLTVYLHKYRELEGDQKNPQQQSQQRNSNDQLIVGNRHQNMPCTGSLPIYHSINATSLVSQSPFATNDHPFSLPYPSTASIQKQLPPQQRFDSVGHW